MNLGAACGYLDASQARFFSEVYKHYDWKDDAALVDYLEFIAHEPAIWLRGFPGKWKSAPQFQRVRASFHKLLRHTAVVEALGEQKSNTYHDVVWHAFKDNLDDIVAMRTGKSVVENKEIGERNILEVMSSDDGASSASPCMRVMEYADAESVASVKIRRTQRADGAMDWKARFDLLAASYRALLTPIALSESESDRYRAALRVFLDRLSDGSASF